MFWCVDGLHAKMRVRVAWAPEQGSGPPAHGGVILYLAMSGCEFAVVAAAVVVGAAGDAASSVHLFHHGPASGLCVEPAMP